MNWPYGVSRHLVEALWHWDVLCVVWMRSGITSKTLVVLGVLLPPRAVFPQHGWVLHTWQQGIKACQNKVLRCKAPQDSTEGYVGQREPTLHSLAHTTSMHIGNSPGTLNYIWAAEGYTTWACSPVVSVMWVLEIFSLADLFVQGGLISSLF